MKGGNYKILVITSTFPIAKSKLSSDFVFQLCLRLKRQGLEVHVLAPHSTGLANRDEIDGLTVHRYRYFIERLQTLSYGSGILENLKSNPLNFLLLPFFLVSQFTSICLLLYRNHYDAVHAHWIIPQGFLAICARFLVRKQHRIPIVCTSHGSDLFKLNNPVLDRLKKWVIENCERPVVVSQYMKTYCARLGIADDNISVIPMGVDLNNSFKPVANVERNRKRLIYVGRLIESKGILCLIEALSVVRKSLSDFELHIIGNGPLRSQIVEQVKQKNLDNNVVLHGEVAGSSLPALYSGASTLIFPSTENEGLGLVAVEALACGCVVIASQLRSLEDIVIHGVNGLMVLSGEVASLADAILKILSDDALYEALAKASQHEHLLGYDWETIAKRYYETIESTILESGKSTI